MSVSPRGKRQKGNQLEYLVRDKIIQSGLDPHARRSIMSGAAFEPADIKTSLPWAIECKNYGAMAIYKFWDQAVRQSTASKKPCLIIKANNQPVLTVITIDDWLELVAWARKGGLED